MRWTPLGVYDLAVYLNPEAGEHDAIRFSLALPTGWEVLAGETCDALLTEGDLLHPENGLALQADGCVSIERPPLARFRVSCSTPGVAYLFGHPSDQGWHNPSGARVRRCTGNWHTIFPGYGDVQAVVIGEPCTSILHGGACPYCMPKKAGGVNASIPAFEVATGSTQSRVVRFWGFMDHCSRPAECGGGSYNADCFGDVQVERDRYVPAVASEWLSVSLPSHEGHAHQYLVTADASDLPPGTYRGALAVVPGSCPFCAATCVPVTMYVAAATSVDPRTDPVGLAFQVIQNPSSGGSLSIRFADPSMAEPAEISLFDAAGRRVAGFLDVRSAASGTVELELPGTLGGGMYFVRARQGMLHSERPVVILR